MKDRVFAITFFGVAIMLLAAVIVSLLVGLIEWLQVGRWPMVSVLDTAYEAQLLSARWFLSVDWRWQLREWLDAVPLPLAAILLAPLFWRIGLFFARR